MSTYDKAIELVLEVVEATSLVAASAYDDEDDLGEEYLKSYDVAMKELREFLKENLKESKPKRKKPMTKQEATDFLISTGVIKPDAPKLLKTIEDQATINTMYEKACKTECIDSGDSLHCWNRTYRVGNELWDFFGVLGENNHLPSEVRVFEDL